MEQQKETVARVAIFAHHRPDALAKLEKLARRAERYGQQITWTERPFVERVKRQLWNGKRIEVELHKIEFEIAGDAPRVGDYRFLAALENVPGGVLISAAKGAEIGKLGREWDGRCDHCGSNRYRRIAFVVEGPDGRRKIVGKSCLRDHLGMDAPAGMLNAFTFEDIEVMGRDEEEGGWGGYGRWEESTLGVVAAARAAIALWGWKPSSYEGRTTAMDVDLVYGRVQTDHKGREIHAEERRLLREELKARGDHYQETAEKVLEWGRNLKPRGDYEHNLKVALAGDIVIGKTYNLVVSAAAAYDRQVAKEDEARKAREAEEARRAAMPKSFHLGQVGERTSAVVTLERKIAMPDRGYGPSVLLKMRADNGPVLCWFTGTYPRVDEKPVEMGDRFAITFTVKKHGNFGDEAETVITRAKVEAVKEAAAA